MRSERDSNLVTEIDHKLTGSAQPEVVPLEEQRDQLRRLLAGWLAEVALSSISQPASVPDADARPAGGTEPNAADA
jgi:hypothetical protein